jgi:hypothetical protein
MRVDWSATQQIEVFQAGLEVPSALDLNVARRECAIHVGTQLSIRDTCSIYFSFSPLYLVAIIRAKTTGINRIST